MFDLFLPSDAQMACLEPFPKVPPQAAREDRRMVSRTIVANRNSLPWRDTPKVYAPHKTLYD